MGVVTGGAQVNSSGTMSCASTAWIGGSLTVVGDTYGAAGYWNNLVIAWPAISDYYMNRNLGNDFRALNFLIGGAVVEDQYGECCMVYNSIVSLKQGQNHVTYNKSGTYVGGALADEAIVGEFTVGLNELRQLNPIRYKGDNSNFVFSGLVPREVKAVIPEATLTENIKSWRRIGNDPEIGEHLVNEETVWLPNTILMACVNAIKKMADRMDAANI